MKSIALLLVGALCQTVFGGFGWPHPPQPETCTEVEGPDGGTASCHCHCTCDIECDDPVDCTVGITGKNIITGFGGGDYPMPTNNKFLTSRYPGVTGSDQCKFQIRSDTEDDVNGNPCFGWMGIAFGVHNKNDAKFERNFRVSLTQGQVEKRGRGIKPPELVVADPDCIETNPFPNSWTFCVRNEGDCWVFDLAVPDNECWVKVIYCEAGKGNNASENDQATITTSDNYNGLLEGACDDQGPDHNINCINADPGPGCIDGDHQNNG